MATIGPWARAIRNAGLAALVVLPGCGDDGDDGVDGDASEDGGSDIDGGQVGPDARYPIEPDPFWSALPEAAGLQPRMQHTAVWSGSEMLIWGGVLGSVQSDPIFGDGGRYDPGTDSWQPITEDDAPAARAIHTAVWTGEEMIVWGGAAYDVAMTPDSTIYTPKYFNDGGRYDPRTDRWRPISLVGAPAPRWGHSAVWTGTEMIVWGGFDGAGTGIRDDGAIYDPSTDTWRPIDTFGLPLEVYSSNEIVWTGSELLLVATSYGSTVPYVVVHHDPTTFSWTLADMAGAPDIVAERVAWTGSELLLWGNRAQVIGTTGGRYDPSTGSWAPMSEAGAPADQGFATMVWTGSRALIWGGRRSLGTGGEIALKTGAAYDPVADAWEALPTPVDNVGREAHTAIWSGGEMIVWGGRTALGPSGQDYLSTGTRYRPE